jgi:hypothetical protein
MKAIALAVGAALTAAASAASAQIIYERPYVYEARPGWGDDRRTWRDERRSQRFFEVRNWRGIPHECWNWRARVFERAREGEFQDDLDYSRCRPMRYEYRAEFPTYRYYYR